MHQAAARAMTGGYSEVSIFWIDPGSGVRLKARLDYLKVKAIVDLKTFSNSLGKPVRRRLPLPWRTVAITSRR